MKTFCTLTIALLTIGTTVETARASDNAYVCSIRVETGFARVSDTAYPHTDQMTFTAQLTSEPYCQGQAVGSLQLQTPKLQVVRSRKQILDHTIKVRNVWQAAVATFQTLSIASAQGAPLNQAITIATNVEEQPAREFAFQAARPASTTAQSPESPTGKNGARASGYVCLSSSKYKLREADQTVTVDDAHNFSLTLFSKPFCLGTTVASYEYEFGPSLNKRGKEAEKLYQATANMNAAGLMHAISAILLEAASSGQHVSVEHTEDGLLSSIEIRARARDLAKEIQTIATPGR